jgi:precorrin-6x reductase
MRFRSMKTEMEHKGKLNLVSVGPGFLHLVPPLAETALRESEVVIGYQLYFTWIQPLIEGKEIYSFPLTQERERVRKAIAWARAGRSVSLVSSGDIGIYGMAPLVLEEMRENESFQLEIVPGISAANSAAALLGSPLSHDFATLSLSDLLCPWEWIENRARHLAQVDLVVALYNVQSQSRLDGVYRILRILQENKTPSTWCGVVRNAFRPDQKTYLCSLQELLKRQFDMLTTIIVGNRFTQKKGRFIYTPRGYQGWPFDNEREGAPARIATRSVAAGGTSENAGNAPSVTPASNNAHRHERLITTPQPTLWIFSGTGDGNALAAELSRKGYRLIVSTASEYGAQLASLALPGVQVRSGKQGLAARRNQLEESGAAAVIDATHPFATEISAQLLQLTRELNIHYIRYERPDAQVPSFAHQVPDMQSAARRAVEVGKRIFLATGIKDLQTFLSEPGAQNSQWFLRITPDTDSLQQALQSGVPRSNLFAMQGPFSTELNIALWSTWKVDCVVTKESGDAGGFGAKVEAAGRLGIPLVVVKRPKLTYPVVASDFEALLSLLECSLAERLDPSRYRDPAHGGSPPSVNCNQ